MKKSIFKKYEEYFSIENLKQIFIEHIVYSRATGIDNLDPYSFRKRIDEQVEIISRKAIAGTYQFTKYKLKLINKGRNKVPREISIPTVRDRIALRALCDFLTDVFEDSLNFELPQKVIREIKGDLIKERYDGYIKLDVSNFYPSIIHAEMMSRVRKRIRHDAILNLINSAIKTPTVSISRNDDSENILGVPQGLSISNVLAAIYLSNIDRYLSNHNKINYRRYVDDLMILCEHGRAEDIARDVITRFKKIGLVVHDPIKAPEKSSFGHVNNGFDYLGYKFYEGGVTPKIASVDKLKESLVSIFTSYKYSKKKSQDFLLWRLNLRITGCVFENKSKGWLFFFSEIDDESLLHSLDYLIQKLMKRFNVCIPVKKFVRAFKELSHNKYETNYIPNYDNFDLSMQSELLRKYFNVNTSKLDDTEIEYEFKKRVGKQVRDLEVDVMDFNYITNR